MRRDPHAPEQPVQNFVTDRPYETRDVNVGVLVRWLILLFVIAGLSSLVTFFFYGLLTGSKIEKQYQFPLETSRAIPPGPVVQAYPMQDIKDFRAKEDAAVESYTLDKQTGHVHLPLETALDQIAAKGISAIEGPANSSAPATGTPPALNRPGAPTSPGASTTQGGSPLVTPPALGTTENRVNMQPRRSPNQPTVPGTARPGERGGGDVMTPPRH
ncbi:MAG TPA: hypothetical protein VFA07_07980 [Chthonomonadaceae bacterium]|nr:hypothetical protein [Chthonomonadaceae bacterium]